MTKEEYKKRYKAKVHAIMNFNSKGNDPIVEAIQQGIKNVKGESQRRNAAKVFVINEIMTNKKKGLGIEQEIGMSRQKQKHI